MSHSFNTFQQKSLQHFLTLQTASSEMVQSLSTANLAFLQSRGEAAKAQFNALQASNRPETLLANQVEALAEHNLSVFEHAIQTQSLLLAGLHDLQTQLKAQNEAAADNH